MSRVKTEQEHAFGGDSSVVRKKNITVLLPGGGGGLIRKGVCYLPGIHPTEGTVFVYTFDIHRKSPRPEEDMLKLKSL